MSETPEQKEAADKLDEIVKETGSRVEREAGRRSRMGRLGSGWWMSFFPRGSKLDPPVGEPGLRAALKRDDEKS
jgi:hypothetical protein